MVAARASAGKSSYVYRLRRAFLLQVHPDRFRNQKEIVRKQQATLVQALSDRMAEHDFLAYSASTSRHKSPSSINRDLLHFLRNTDYDHIKQRKLSRIHATAAALVARRAFAFSAIDGTGLGWSSSSLAICLSRLTSLHEEHGAKLLVRSFYPFRLLLSNDEFHCKVDPFAGVVRLNPAATSLQWLGTLATVSDDSVRALKENQSELRRNILDVESALGVRPVKGHTCEPEEYHRCVGRLASESRRDVGIEDGGKSELTPSSNKATLVIESAQDCRGGRLRTDGNFAVGAGTDLRGARMTIGEHASRSNERIRTEMEKRATCRAVVERFVREFGVLRVDGAGPAVTSDDVSGCLSALLERDAVERRALRGYLAGQSIGVAGRGHLCHLGDDGSIVVPANCS
ncbi:hypothetical protein ACHAW5_010504 [Stephanodiscus triporus]|uniref:DUF4461 domain-containing protein n=1 Tax=Stephanodiscus triporus TaxID=2934178 RepID=A0ABD3PBK6_9STRA